MILDAGRAFERLGDRDRAMSLYCLSMKLGVSADEAILSVVRMMIPQGRLDDVVSFLIEATFFASDKSAIRTLRSQLQVKLRLHTFAMAEFSKRTFLCCVVCCIKNKMRAMIN